MAAAHELLSFGSTRPKRNLHPFTKWSARVLASVVGATAGASTLVHIPDPHADAQSLNKLYAYVEYLREQDLKDDIKNHDLVTILNGELRITTLAGTETYSNPILVPRDRLHDDSPKPYELNNYYLYDVQLMPSGEPKIKKLSVPPAALLYKFIPNTSDAREMAITGPLEQAHAHATTYVMRVAEAEHRGFSAAGILELTVGSGPQS